MASGQVKVEPVHHFFTMDVLNYSVKIFLLAKPKRSIVFCASKAGLDKHRVLF